MTAQILVNSWNSFLWESFKRMRSFIMRDEFIFMKEIREACICESSKYRKDEDGGVWFMGEPPIVVHLCAGYTSDITGKDSVTFGSGN